LLPVIAGVAVLFWVIALHREEALKHGWRIEKTPFEPLRYLIVRGPYRYTRNPIYLSHLAIWSGWTLFYGSAALLLGVLCLWMALAFVVLPYEERGLARELGEPYEQYRRQVGRWLPRRGTIRGEAGRPERLSLSEAGSTPLSDPVEALVLDLLEWIGPEPRPHAEVIDAWRTSCPRLPVWEDANDRGFVECRYRPGGEAVVAVTARGRAFLERHRPPRSTPPHGLESEVADRRDRT
jgi:D-3-phosphoglycerate dehydrogenase